LAPACAIVASLVVHGMAVGSDFIDEEIVSFYQLAVAPADFLMSPHGGHFTGSYGLVVLALRALFGSSPGPFFALVLSTHLLNVFLLYGVVRSLTRSVGVAGLAAGLWGSAPAFQGTLQWFSAYDHMLGVTAMLWALFETARAAEARRSLTGWELARTNFLLFAGAAAALNGTLVAVLFPAVAFFLLPRDSGPRRTALWFLPAALASLVVVGWVASGAILASFDQTPSGDPGLSMGDVAMRFGRLALYGVGVVFAGPLVTASAGRTTMGLLGIESVDMMTGLCAVFFLPVLGLVTFGFVHGDRTDRRALLALLGLAVALYASVAIGRSRFDAVDTMVQDRFHYDATPPMVAAIAIALANSGLQLRWPTRRGGAIALGILASGWLAADWLTARTTWLHGGGRQEWTRDWMDIADGAILLLLSRTPGQEPLHLRNDPFRPAELLYAMGLPRFRFPGIGAWWITAHGLEGVNGRRIRFVEEDAALLEEIRARSPAAVSSMFVSPEDVVGARGSVRTIEAEAPADVVEYLEGSFDPTFAPNDHAWADRLRRSLADAVTGGRPWTPARPTPRDPSSASRPSVRPEQQEGMRRAIEQDPKAMEEFRRGIQRDPKGMEALREALTRQKNVPKAAGEQTP
jgi:hypothetical protein